MSIRRYVSLMHGLDYSSVPTDPTAPPEERGLSSKEDIRAFFGGAIRVSGGE